MSTSKHFIILALVLFTCTNPTLAVTCPVPCSCLWELDSYIVDCSNRGLKIYPYIEEGLPVDRLDLSHNFFQTFPTQYANIDSLIYLDLSHNDIQELADDALVGFDALRNLNLANNGIESWSDIKPNVAFQHAYSLQKLSLAGNYLERFSDSEGAPLLMSDLLIELDLSNCGITHVSNVLSGMPSLEKLILSGNKLNALPSLPSKTLLGLDISNCSLTWVPKTLIDSLPSLKVLDLSWNFGLTLGSDVGDILECPTLLRLDMSYCNSDAVNLSGMPNLLMLKLSGNMLRSISGTMFSNNTVLEKLDLSRNVISQLDPTAFYNLRKLTDLDLSYNGIIRVDKNQFRNNEALVSINFSRNIFNEFSKFISNSLRSLNYSYCEIMQIDQTAFTGFKTLVSLDLSNNLISQFPANMESETLKKLDLSMCRLSLIKNTTFHGFPELASLKLFGNRFTNPFLPEYFKSNVYLNRIWLGDNLWRCDCYDATFMAFYDYLTARPQKIQDKSNLRCFSPTAYYGKTWEGACLAVWYPARTDKAAQKVWTYMMIILLLLGVGLLVGSCFRKYVRRNIKRRNREERLENERELQEIRRQNRNILDQDAQQNAPTAFESMLPSYEDALLMPKMDRTSKSMVDLSSNRKPLSRVKRDPELGFEEEESVLDHHRFRSMEMLSNRDKERTAQVGTFRRTGRIDHNPSGTRRFSIEDSRFPAAHLRSQNLQSAERIGNFQSYENSPYSKRRPKPPIDISVFKRASIRDSVEFLTDSEYNSKPGSPFAQRRPGPEILTASSLSLRSGKNRMPSDKSFNIIEEHFGRDTVDNKSARSSSSDFQVMRSSDVDLNSLMDSSSSKVDLDGPVVVVHTPVRESKF